VLPNPPCCAPLLSTLHTSTCYRPTLSHANVCCVRRRGAALFGSMAFRQHIHSLTHSLITRLLALSYPALAEGFVCGVYDDIIVYVCASCIVVFFRIGFYKIQFKYIKLPQ
jgi:hypothetical protein